MVKAYKPTQAIKNNSSRGVALFEKANSLANQAIKSKVKPYSDLITKGELNLEEVKQLYTFLTKAETKYKPNNRLEGNNIDSDTAAFLSAGGSSALAWSRMILKEEDILKSYKKEITEEELNSENELQGLKLPVTKAVNEEKRVATFVILEPQYEGGMTSDLHSDWYSEDDVFQAMTSFNRSCMKASIFHMMDVSAIEFLESYCTKTDMALGGRFIKKGTWLGTIYCPPDNDLSEQIWQGIKNGTFTGLSIQCSANAESLPD